MLILASKVPSHSAYLSSICRDAANTWEADTAFKPPNVLFNCFLGSMAHDHILEVRISLSFHDMSI